MPRKHLLQGLALGAALLASAATGKAQSAEPRALISQTIDERQLVTLAGNTRPEANLRNDAGPVPDELHLDMFLELRRSPERELAAKQFVESLTDRASGNFHHWISAAEYGRRFGAAPEDIATVLNWLGSHGFTVNGVKANQMVIDFSGNAGQVRAALHTAIHHLEIAGKRYFANMSDPQIPAALAPAVAGVVSLSNFMPQPGIVPRSQFTMSGAMYTLVPGDLATIYNLNAAFAAGFTGRGQTIVLVEDTDLYNDTADWEAFRQTFGLDQYSNGSLTQVHPAPGTGGAACADPGINGDDIEAALDVEWASAAAPDAAIVMASCADTANFGGFIALQNMLENGNALPSVVSISYGETETMTGATLNHYINTLYQTAAAAGVSVFVSSGDAAATGFRAMAAVFGINVSGWASTPYNVAVGGTDFGDGAANSASDYWNASNGPYYDSAKSYVPEIPWNDSCGSSVIASHFGYGASYGPAGFCQAYPLWASTIGGSGGPSACATGAPDLDLAVSGTCAGYAKPAWQNVFGNPSDGVRDVPDVSLFAADGFWGHYYVICFSAWASCTGDPSNWVGVGGTSASSPIMAGIQAVINQALGVNNVGNPNPVYYQIAQNEFSTAAGRAACNSTTGPAADCSFIDITQGDIVANCAGAFNCYLDGEPIGVLSTSTTSYEPAYPATPGWDFATGIGSVNAYSLLHAFVASVAPTGVPPAPTLISPASGATGVLPNPSLSWNSSDGAASYDVYFGTSSQPPLAAGTNSLNYSPGPLTPATTYYWAIGARNQLGANASPAWSFTTGCTAALNPSSVGVGAAGGSGTIPVTAASGCQWAAASNAAWITITSGGSGSGNGTVGYSVAANTGADRTGTITIAGQTLLVTQGGIYPLISALAGGSTPLTGTLGTSLSIPVSWGLAVDSSGNAYFPSPNLNVVFRVDATGVVTRLAGTGVAGYAGDGGSALTAQLYSPGSVAVDGSGNVYIADNSNSRIRKVDASGNITTVAGSGSFGYSGDGGPATGALLGFAYGLAVDSSGNLYFSDWDNSVVRKVDASGIISTVAGTGAPGFSGDGGPGGRAQLAHPYGLAVDSSGNLYVADNSNGRIRKVDTSGTITTVAGTGTCCYAGDGGAAINTQLGYPDGVAVDAAGILYIADSGDSRVRKVDRAGIITTIAGNGYGFSGDGGAAVSARLAYPGGVAVDAAGNVYVTDIYNMRIRKVNAAGNITTLVGGAVNDGELGVFGLLNAPAGVARDSAGNTYIADTNNNRVRKVDASGIITTVAGTGLTGFSGDGGAATNAQLRSPQAVAVDAAGNLYIADSGNSRIRKVDASGNVRTIAGNGGPGYSGDGGPATAAQISPAYGLAVDSSGNLYMADSNSSVVRKINSSGIITTVAGNGTAGFSGDGGAATAAQLQNPNSVAVDSSGNLYIADTNNQRVRKVDGSGTITTVAGTGTCCYSGDGGAATNAELAYPDGVAVDAAGNLYITGNADSRVREVNTAGMIITIAGSGTLGYSGDGGLASAATMRSPFGLAVDATGILAVADQGNNAIRFLVPGGTRPVLGVRSVHSSALTPSQAGAVYTVTVSNAASAGPTQGTVTVTETLPGSLALVSMVGPGWTCAAPAQPTCTRSDALNPGSSYPAITVTVNVSATAPSQLSTQVAVSGGGAGAAGAEDFTIVMPSSAGGGSSSSSHGCHDGDPARRTGDRDPMPVPRVAGAHLAPEGPPTGNEPICRSTCLLTTGCSQLRR